MRMLIIDDRALKEVKLVKEFALAHRMNLHDILRCMRGMDVPGDDPNRRVFFSLGWKVVYTIEQQADGWYHHISVSVSPTPVSGLRTCPSKQGVAEILKLFGLGTPEEADIVFEEPIFIKGEGIPTGGKAINLLFKLKAE